MGCSDRKAQCEGAVATTGGLIGENKLYQGTVGIGHITSGSSSKFFQLVILGYANIVLASLLLLPNQS